MHQTVDNAFGLTVHAYGPTSLIRNDIALLRLSRINMTMSDLQEGDPVQYKIFGDSAYSRQSHIFSYYKFPPPFMTEAHQQWNHSMKSVRISIEWNNYGFTASLFKLFRNNDKLRLLQSGEVAKLYMVGTLLRNFHVIMYGCQTSNYFNVRLPQNFLEHYIAQTDFN